MKKKIYLIIGLAICFMLSGCNKEYGNDAETKQKFNNCKSEKESLLVKYEENLSTYYALSGNGTGQWGSHAIVMQAWITQYLTSESEKEGTKS